MFSFIPILFIYLFINKWSDAKSLSTETCLTFKKIQDNVTNSCGIFTILPMKIKCLKCDIKTINNITENTCIKNLTCVELKFPNDFILEYTMKEYRMIIYNLFTSKIQQNIFNITLKIFNQTYITKSFIESILGNYSTYYHSFYMYIFKQNKTQTLPNIDANLTQIQLTEFYLNIPCHNRKGYIRHNISKSRIISKEDNVCKVLTTVTQEITSERLTSTMTIDTSSLSSSTTKPPKKFRILFLLLGLLLITIFTAFIIMCFILENRRKPSNTMNETDSNESDKDTEISNISDTWSFISTSSRGLSPANSTPNSKTRTTVSFDNFY